MVEQVRISPEEVRGYGNICEEHSLDDFIVSSSGLAKEKEDVHGALTEVYKLVYSLYGLIFDFDKGAKQLYLHSDNDAVVGFSFSENSLVFNTVSHISFDFVDKNLVVDDEHYLFIDEGTSSNHNTNYTVGNAVTKTVGDNYTTLSATNANSTTGRTYSTPSFSGDLTLEMEINVDYDSNWAFYLGFRNSTNHSIARIEVGGWKYIKFTRENGVCKGYISTNNNTWSELTMYSDEVGTNNVQLELYLYNKTGTSHSVQFKNVRIY